jgi:C_GCAxxG_C_C family probable redox protein
MILNGGVAYSGGVCGALTGAGLALGRLAAERIDGHREAKATARRILMRLMAEFREEFGATDCRTLTGYDMIEDHDEFMEDGTWKTTCTRQLEYVVERLESLHDPDEWAAILQEMEIS